MLRIPLPEYDGFALRLSKQLTVNRRSEATAPTALALPCSKKEAVAGMPPLDFEMCVKG